MQESFSTLWEGYATDKAAIAARNARARALREQGHTVTCFVLRNQQRQYAGFGQPDGRSCNVYYLQFD